LFSVQCEILDLTPGSPKANQVFGRADALAAPPASQAEAWAEKKGVGPM